MIMNGMMEVVVVVVKRSARYVEGDNGAAVLRSAVLEGKPLQLLISIHYSNNGFPIKTL